MSGFRRAAVLAAATLAFPAPVLAHTTIEGIDAVYGGFLHPYFVPQHLLALIALALLAGVMKWRAAAIALPAFLAALVLGLGLGATGVPPAEPLIALLALAMLCGAGAAAGAPSLPTLPAIAGVLIGLTVGLDSVPESGARFDVLAATAIGAAIPPVWLGCLLIRFHRPWVRLAARVLGAWVVAASAMVLALAITA